MGIKYTSLYKLSHGEMRCQLEYTDKGYMEFAWVLVVVQLIFLFVTSQKISQALFYVFEKISRSRKVAVGLLSFLFFPGVVVHELSHFLMASLLFVRVGDIELTPQLQADGIKMGSVQIAKTDILRRFLIGVAPLIFGFSILVVGIYSFFNYFPFAEFKLSWQYILSIIVVLYGVFVITNTMFSSKKDMEGAFGLFIFILFLLAVIFVAGKGEWVISLFNALINNATVQQYSSRIALLLLVPVGINLLAVSVFKLRKRS